NAPHNALDPFTTSALPSTVNGPGFVSPLVVTGNPPDVPVGGDCMCSGSPNNARELTTETAGVIDQSTCCNDFSPAGVRYATGAVERNFTDLQSNGYGLGEGMTRSFTNAFSPTYTWEGKGMVISQQPYLVQNGTGVIVVLSDADAIYFDKVGSNYVPHWYSKDTLTSQLVMQGMNRVTQYTFTDTIGDSMVFWGFDTSFTNEWGTLDSFTDPNGQVTSVTARTSDGKVQDTQRTAVIH